jgi:signal transduction histidine kinase
MLHEFIVANRDEIIRRCRVKVASRAVPPFTAAEIDHGVPMFLDQLVHALRHGVGSTTEISETALQHGRDLLHRGFTVSQLVHDYGDICQVITTLAVQTDEAVSTDEFRTLNRCLDDAIAGAVTEFGRGHDQSTVDAESARGSERLGYLAHELRNLVNTAMVAFEVVKTGNVGVGGSTGSVLQRSLQGLQALATRSLAEVRVVEGVYDLQRFEVSAFIDELTAEAALDAAAQGRAIRFRAMPFEDGLIVEADRQVLTAAVRNVLQNAFKFTRDGSTVTLRLSSREGLVSIEIEDECGGLPAPDIQELFEPFERRGTVRTGLGLGLAFSRKAIEASRGHIQGRNLPDQGCIFTIELPLCLERGVTAT